MSRNPGYVTDHGFLNSAKGWKQEILMEGDFFSLGGGKLRWSAFDNVNLFQSIKTTLMNIN